MFSEKRNLQAFKSISIWKYFNLVLQEKILMHLCITVGGARSCYSLPVSLSSQHLQSHFNLLQCWIFEKVSCNTLSTNQKCQTAGRRFPRATTIFVTSEPFLFDMIERIRRITKIFLVRTSSVAHSLLLDTSKYSNCIHEDW